MLNLVFANSTLNKNNIELNCTEHYSQEHFKRLVFPDDLSHVFSTVRSNAVYTKVQHLRGQIFPLQ